MSATDTGKASVRSIRQIANLALGWIMAGFVAISLIGNPLQIWLWLRLALWPVISRDLWLFLALDLPRFLIYDFGYTLVWVLPKFLLLHLPLAIWHWTTTWPLAKIPVGRMSKLALDWIQSVAAPLFDWIQGVLDMLIEAVLRLLTEPYDYGWLVGAEAPRPVYPEAVHAYVIVALFTGLTWLLQRNWKICLLVLAGFLFILNQGYWEATAESLTLVLSACVVCMAAGVPIGIAAAHRPRLYDWMRPVLDLMQTLPTFVYLIPAIVFFGIGMVPGLIATVIFVLPAPIRLTHLGISTTPTALLEAAEAFGATRRQTLWKVELPFALPQIMAGLNQTIMLSLSMVVIAALVGADGLGVPVVRALNSVNPALGFESGFVIVVVAILLDRMLRVSRR